MAKRRTRSRRTNGTGHVRQLPSRRWQAKFPGPNGNVYPGPTTFDTRIDAEEWLREQTRAVDRGSWRAPAPQRPAAGGNDDATLAGYAWRWLEERDLKPRTRGDYRRLIEQWIEPAFGSYALEQITPAMIRSWHADLAPGRPTTRAHAYGLLRTILGTAVDDDVIAANPCRIRGAGSTKRDKTITVATIPEVTAIAEAMPDRLAAMVWLAAWCGLRFGEVTELRRRDVDLAAGVLRVRRGVVRADGEVIVDTPKSTAGIRDVTIPPHVVPLIARSPDRHVARGRGCSAVRVRQRREILPPATFYGWYSPGPGEGRPARLAVPRSAAHVGHVGRGDRSDVG
ncbi:MAG: site-specific integrase [Candidatus Nanopelagicales bacterium]